MTAPPCIQDTARSLTLWLPSGNMVKLDESAWPFMLPADDKEAAKIAAAPAPCAATVSKTIGQGVINDCASSLSPVGSHRTFHRISRPNALEVAARSYIRKELTR